MESLNKQRETKKQLEIQQIILHKKYEERIKRDFDTVKASETLLELQYNADTQIILESLNKWLKHAKNENQKNTINEMFMCIMRMSSYTETIRTLSKRAVSELMQERRNLSNSESKRIELQRENEILKKEIDFINK